ncbi:hypothetical protein MLAC_39920 [Mycobacterium lacus]|uniref:HTH merR-type domain-containing protein n=1 Tax=Mycobacterium lacus TaxID=169765 RepID=A0A7I7NQK1_9MYCO|nr:redox-sensitive transcriptional activator SoxR [Mycobacterium lacus]BBX98698.1 hypothetical protein MLAC_39920 [Mycobacterium lacus]
MDKTDLFTVSELANRSGFAASAIRFYESQGLITASRTAGGQRRFERQMLRRLAFIRAARNVGLSLDEVAAALAKLPDGRTPTRADWTRLSKDWRARLDGQIAGLVALRDNLDSAGFVRWLRGDGEGMVVSMRSKARRWSGWVR